MQKSTRHVVIQKGGIHAVARQHQRQRQITATDALGQAQQVRPQRWLTRRGSLLHCKESASTAAAHRNLIGNHQYLVLIAQRPCRAQVAGVVHRHTRSALYQRLQNQRGNLPVARFQQCLQLGNGALGHIDRRFTGQGLARVG